MDKGRCTAENAFRALSSSTCLLCILYLRAAFIVFLKLNYERILIQMSHCPPRWDARNVKYAYVACRSESKINSFPLTLFFPLYSDESSGEALWCQFLSFSKLTGVSWICLICYESPLSPTGDFPFSSQAVPCTLVFCTCSRHAQSIPVVESGWTSLDSWFIRSTSLFVQGGFIVQRAWGTCISLCKCSHFVLRCCLLLECDYKQVLVLNCFLF